MKFFSPKSRKFILFAILLVAVFAAGYFGFVKEKFWQHLSSGEVAGETNEITGENLKDRRAIAEQAKDLPRVELEKKEIFPEAKKDFKKSENATFKIALPKKGDAKKQSRILEKMVETAQAAGSQVIAATLTDPKGTTLSDADIFVDETGEEATVTVKKPEREFVPGKYELGIEILSADGQQVLTSAQDFTWGVLAINPDQSVYTPGSEASIAIGVLDNFGEMVCDAKLELKIQNEKLKINEKLSTEDGRIKVNEEICRSKEMTTEPDYFAEFKFAEVGKYTLTLTAETRNGTHALTDHVLVEKNPPFTVRREAPTRIYPPNSYPVAATVTAREDFSGALIETVPASFAVRNASLSVRSAGADSFSPYASRSTIQKTGADKKIVFENVSIRKGDELKLTYNFTAPNVSPAFYLMGNLELVDSVEVSGVTSASVKEYIGPFEIERIGPTETEDPNINQMVTKVRVKEDFDGYAVDLMPSSFSTMDEKIFLTKTENQDGHVSVSKTLIRDIDDETAADDPVLISNLSQGDIREIVWQAPWKVGDTYDLMFQFDPEDFNPNAIDDFLKFTTKENLEYPIDEEQFDWSKAGESAPFETGEIIFSENRAWQIAADATTSAKPPATAAESAIGTCTSPNTSGAGISWTGYTNVYADDTSYATVSLTDNTCSDYIKATNFGFTTSDIPSGSTINGITANVRRWSSFEGRLSDESVKIVKGGTIQGTEMGISRGTPSWETAETTVPYGSSTEKWGLTWADTDIVGNTGFGLAFAAAKPSTLNNAYTGTVDWITITVDYTTPITISGTSNLAVGTTVAIAVGGTNPGTTTTVQSGSPNTFSLSAIVPSGQPVVVWADGVADSSESTAVTDYDGSGNISGMVLNSNVTSVGSDDSPSMTLTELNVYDCSQDEDIMYQAESSTLKVEGDSCAGSVTNSYTAEKIDILSGDTLTVSGTETLTTYDLTISGTGTLTSGGNSTYNVAHDWTNNASGTFTASTSTVNFNGSALQTITSAGDSFNAVTFNNSSVADPNINYTGALTIGGATTLSNNTRIASTDNTAVTFSGTVNGGYAMSVNAGSSTATFSNTVGNSTALNDFDVTAATIYLNTTGVTANAGVGGATVTFTGAVSLGANVTVNTDNTNDNNVSFTSTVNADDAGAQNRTFTVTAGTGTITYSGVVGGTQALADFDNTAATIYLNAATFTVDDQGGNTATFTGAVSLGAGVTIDTDNSTDNNLSFTSTINSTDTTDRAFAVTAGAGDVTVSGAIGATNDLASLTVGGNDISLNNVGGGASGVVGATAVTGDASGTITLTGTTYNTAGTQAWNAGGATRTITLNEAATFTTTDDTITFTGLVNSQAAENNGITLNAGTAQVTFNNNVGATQSLGTLTKQGSGDVLFGSNTLTATGLTLSAGTINNAATDSGVWTVSGNVTISSGTLKATTSTFNVGGNWSNSGTFTANSGLVTLNGSGAQALSGTMTSGSAFNNLTVTNASASGVTFSDSTTVTGTFTDTTNDSKLIFTVLKTFAFANVSIAGGGVGDEVILTSSNASPGTPGGDRWYFNVSTSKSISYVTVYDSDATGSYEMINPTSSNDGGNNVNWFPAGISIAGTSNIGVGTTVRVAVNNSLKSQVATVQGDTSWTISAVTQPSASDIITIFATDGDGDIADDSESTAIMTYSGSGNVTGMALDINVLSIGAGENSTTTVANLCNATYNYDNGDDEDVMHSCSGATLKVDDDGVYAGDKIDILSGDTLTVSGTETLEAHDAAVNGTLTSGGASTYTISGSWDNNSVFTASTSTVTMNATSGTETIDSSGASTASFNNLILGTSGTAQWNLSSALDVDGYLTLSFGTLNCNGQDQNIAGDLSLADGTTFSKGGTLAFDTSGTSNVTDSNTTTKQDLGAVSVTGTTKTLSTSSAVKMTTVTLQGSDDALNITDDTLTLTGTGTPITLNSGTFTTTNSSVSYVGAGSVNILNTTYNNLQLAPATTGQTYTLGVGVGQTIPVNGNFTVNDGSGTETVVVTAATNNPTLDVNGDFTVNNYGTFTGGSQNIIVGTDGEALGDFTLENGSTWNAGSGTLILDGGDDVDLVYFEDKNGTKQNLGTVQIGASPATTNMSSDMTADSLTVSTGDRLNTKGYDLNIATFITVNGTLDGTQSTSGNGTNINLGTTWTVASGGTFTAQESETYPTTVTFDESSNGNLSPGGTDEAHDFYNIAFTKSASATITMQAAIDVENNFTISNSNSTLDAAGYAIAVGGDWSNSGTFTHGNNTVTFDSADTGETIDSGGTTNGIFYNVIFNNSGGGWTVQTSDVLIDNNLTFTSVSSWANSKTIGIRVGGTLTVSANQDIRMWNSSAANGYTVASDGSLYSMDHNSEDGVLYIWGDYHVATNDYWSYAADFDNAGVSRRVVVRIDPSANVTVDSGDTLAGIGTASAGMTIVDRQGTSGGYGITVSSGGTINFNYVDFENLEGSGLNVQSTGVTDLDNCKFNNLVDVGATDAFITVDASVITSNKTWDNVQFDNSSGGANYNVYRTGTGGANYWSFANHTGTFDGATYEYEADASDMIQWASTIDSTGGRETIEGAVQFEGATTIQ